ncbi:MAG: hypothetical protein ACOCUU_03795 [Nanoarchaeota archaeon]
MVKEKSTLQNKEDTEQKENKKVSSKKLTKKQIQDKIVELANSGLTCEKIGESLKKEGIYPKENKIKISKVLKEKGIYTNPDLKNVENKLNRIKNHYENNKQDKRAKREKDRIFGHLRKLKKYFKVQ